MLLLENLYSRFLLSSTFGVRCAVSWEYVGILQFSDVIQADAQAHVVDHLSLENDKFTFCSVR